MTLRIRNLAFGLLLAGLVFGTVNDRTEVGPPTRVSEYFLLTGDFHVHAFPGDGALTAWDLRAEARRRRLDVITVSNHNHMVAARIGHALFPGDERPIVIPGQEVTAPGFHLIALGVARTVSWDQPASSVIDSVHAQGGVAIAAHPTSEFWAGYDAAAIARLDGTEAAHPAGNEGYRQELLAFYKRTAERARPIAAIGSSDFHFAAPLGVCRTVLFVREISKAGVIEAIREGRTLALDSNGDIYGDPALVGLIDRQTILEQPAAGAGKAIATVCVWLGLAGLAVLGGVRRGSRLA